MGIVRIGGEKDENKKKTRLTSWSASKAIGRGCGPFTITPSISKMTPKEVLVILCGKWSSKEQIAANDSRGGISLFTRDRVTVTRNRAAGAAHGAERFARAPRRAGHGPRQRAALARRAGCACLPTR